MGQASRFGTSLQNRDEVLLMGAPWGEPARRDHARHYPQPRMAVRRHIPPAGVRGPLRIWVNQRYLFVRLRPVDGTASAVFPTMTAHCVPIRSTAPRRKGIYGAMKHKNSHLLVGY